MLSKQKDLQQKLLLHLVGILFPHIDVSFFDIKLPKMLFLSSLNFSFPNSVPKKKSRFRIFQEREKSMCKSLTDLHLFTGPIWPL